MPERAPITAALKTLLETLGHPVAVGHVPDDVANDSDALPYFVLHPLPSFPHPNGGLMLADPANIVRWSYDVQAVGGRADQVEAALDAAAALLVGWTGGQMTTEWPTGQPPLGREWIGTAGLDATQDGRRVWDSFEVAVSAAT